MHFNIFVLFNLLESLCRYFLIPLSHLVVIGCGFRF
jgi:hypothetical protein